ncbi:MAG: transglutaminase family protein [Acidobacteriaceae bacterium]
MLIRLGYDIQFDVRFGATFLALLRVHPSRQADLQEPDLVQVAPLVPVEDYTDLYGNIGTRFLCPAGPVRLSASCVVRDSGELDAIAPDACEVPVHTLPPQTLPYLTNSRYCEVDLMSPIAADLFGGCTPGWGRVQSVCDWVKQHVGFDYTKARPTKTALETYTERVGVCRDFQHLAITFCRALNIPARYATGYLGDIGVPAAPDPMDFSAWFEAYLSGQWWTFDARHNQRRIGRVLVATGRDATDVAITTTFGEVKLTRFTVVTEQVKEEA